LGGGGGSERKSGGKEGILLVSAGWEK